MIVQETMQGRLTVKQEKFCREYARSGNAVQSYISAYEKNNSYSVAGVESHRLFTTRTYQICYDAFVYKLVPLRNDLS